MQKRQQDIDAAQIERIIDFLKENGAGSVVRRSDVAKVSCGMLNSGTLANADSAKTGPKERITFGAVGKVSYPLPALAEYMHLRGFKVETRQDAAA